MPSLIVVTPTHRCDAGMAIAAVRAGAWGILDLGYGGGEVRRRAFDRLRRVVRDRRTWGVRVDLLGSPDALRGALADLGPDPQLPLVWIAGLSDGAVAGAVEEARRFAERVVVEAYGVAEARAAEAAGADGVVLKGNESGGHVSPKSTFLLLQHLRGQLGVPCWVQGGLGPDTAAAAALAGADGLVFGEQLWLTREAPFDDDERRRWQRLDGTETLALGDERQYRFFARADRERLQDLERQIEAGAPWPEAVRDALRTPETGLVPLGQEIAFAAAARPTVADVLKHVRATVAENLRLARSQRALAADGPLARSHGTRYPICQGPMTRVSDVAPFCQAVAENGALPFLALALLRGPEVRALLEETRDLLGDRPWGAGILGFVPADLRKEQLAVLHEFGPAFALIAGGRPSQARELEEAGIPTYLHVPSCGLLEAFLADGARRFIFEGRECGGHVGPQSSFNLWQSAVSTLSAAEIDDPEAVHVLFAGGIHDDLSSAMVAATAAPLVERGMKIGVLMGTAYLFTEEAVGAGAIEATFQQESLRCTDTALLTSGVGHATRCAVTPFVSEFQDTKRRLVQAGKSAEEIRDTLEMLNVGRLRIASKGLSRMPVPGDGHAKGDLVRLESDEQLRQGMYMIGEVATLRDRVVPMQTLHEAVSNGATALFDDRLATEVLQADPAPPPPGEPIAIVGIGAMFPESPDLETYWQNIVRRFNAVREVPSERWEADDFFSPDRLAPDRIYSKWGSFLDDVVFDPLRYAIPPNALRSIEPVQLLALEVASAALRDAGFERPGFPKDRTAVIYAASGSHDLGLSYSFRTMMRHYLPRAGGLSEEQCAQVIERLDEQLPTWTEDSFAGFLMNVIAGRISNRLDLQGPNFTVDAACAASLAAVYIAMDQLRAGTCDAALVGAVDGTNNPFGFTAFAKTHALSAKGTSRPFDEDADGIVVGEGVAAIVLKRLSDAERDGDHVYAVIRGIGSSSDGRSRSLTAPSPEGQGLALERAYADARVSPATVGLVEAHSTGTAVGDRVEVKALQHLLKASGAGAGATAVGSVKSMIGHTKTTAGLASLIKTTLALKHQMLPSTLGVERPNEQFAVPDSPLYISAENRPWFRQQPDLPRRAGVSAFGFGGTNFHVVLEEYESGLPDGPDRDLNPRPCELFFWRRADRAALAAALDAFAADVASAAPVDLAQLAFSHLQDETARPDAARDGCRLAVVAVSTDDLVAKARQAAARLRDGESAEAAGVFYGDDAPLDPEAVCFLYSGQGSQAVNMLRDLVLLHPWSYEAFETADAHLAGFFEQPLSRYVYPVPAFDEAARKAQQEALNDTRVAQPALALADLFVHDLLGRYGVRPAMTAGHSYGEYVALCAAGAFSREALYHLSAERGRAVYDAGRDNPGAMAAVFADADATAEAVERLGLAVQLANLNAPDQTVVAGTTEAVDDAVERLTEAGLRARRIPVTAAFHTEALAAARDRLQALLADVDFRPTDRPVFSNTTADAYPADPVEARALLARHMTEPVRFTEQIRALYDRGARLFIEAGPGSALTGLVRRTLHDRAHTAVAAGATGPHGWLAFAQVLGRLLAEGLPVRLETAFARRGLDAVDTATLLERTRAARTPGPTAWVVNASRARPVNAPERPTPKRPAPQRTPTPSTPPATPPSPTGDGSAAAQPASLPVPTNEPKASPSVPDTPMSVSPETRPALSIGSDGMASGDALSQFQATMTQWLALQERQQEANERFLEMQERIMLAYLQGPQAASAPPPRSRTSDDRPSNDRTAARRETLYVPPTPLLPPLPDAAPAPAQAAAPTAPATPAPEPPRAVDGATAAHASTNANGALSNGAAPAAKSDAPPSTEQFRQDLLQAVMDRTGYPVEMLGEDRPLEADLGIDSIKIVEIFSALKQYHGYLSGDDQDQEENLRLFAQMKTLGDIVTYYDERREALTSAPAKAAPAKAAPAPEAPAAPTERHTLKAVSAPPIVEAEKKKTSPGRTSSS